MKMNPSTAVRREAQEWLRTPLNYSSRPLSPRWQAAVAVLAIWSLMTDVPGLLAERSGSAPNLALSLISLAFLALGPLLSTVRCWPGALVTLIGALPELSNPASHALLFLSLTVLICAFTGTRRVSCAVLVLVLAWMTVNAALIPFDYLFVNVGAAVSISLLYGICRAGIRSREQFERSTAEQQQAELDHTEALMAGRRQITRDLHDVIAHDVTVIALQADAALAGSDAGFRQQSLEAISDAAHRSLTDLRSMMQVLSPALEGEAAPTDSSLTRSIDDIVGHLRRLGYPTEVEVTGDPDTLPAMILLGVRPVLRECSTNVIVHALPGSPVRFTVRSNSRSLVLEVSNELSTGGAAARTPRGGFGLGFMRERVERLGGQLSTGIDGGQWKVRATFPVNPAGEAPEAANVAVSRAQAGLH
jgi:signal transduction histidine kinase